jgi:hypothetical protein
VAASVSFTLKKCPHCDSHHVSANLAHWTVQKKPAQKTIATLDRTGEAPKSDDAGVAAAAA